MSRFELLCGSEQIKNIPWRPFDEKVCVFLDDWSVLLRKDVEAKKYPDVLTFAFWIRKANIQKKKNEFLQNDDKVLLGRGLAFHVAPSNVPVNCMYTYVFGLLAGNANIVRVPSKSFPQVEVLVRVLCDVFQMETHREIWERTMIVRYERESNATVQFSKLCDVRVIWGGDETICNIRRAYLPPRSKEITFSDRYSFGVISEEAIEQASEKELISLAERFYNDTYLMDQNACSAPHLIFWWRDCVSEEEGAFLEIQKRFWNTVARVAEKYDFADIKCSEKYADLCEHVATVSEIVGVEKYSDNLLCVCDVSELPKDVITVLRGKYGLFYQYRISNEVLIPELNNVKVQTCAYYGMNAKRICDWILENHLGGIDRIVPFGKTLDIDLVWDGYDLIREMSRRIEFE